MSEPLLTVTDLRAGYGTSLILHDLSFSMGVEAVAIVGRNGMGKTTLCNALMGLVKPTGSITFHGSRIDGLAPEKIARAGIGYVPQGRRLFPSLTVDEHLRMIAKKPGPDIRWTPDAVYDLFPRLAERRRNGGGDLSGGEQQMLAVGRALLLNSALVIMDEPSEGLAPTIVDVLTDAVHHLVDEGVAVLVVEQNLHAATEMADRQLAMVSGRIEAEMTSEELRSDAALQKRYLGVDA